MAVKCNLYKMAAMMNRKFSWTSKGINIELGKHVTPQCVWQCYLSSDLFNGERVFGWSRSAAHTVDCDDFKSVFDTGENILKKHKFNICFTKTFWSIQIENFLTRDCIFHWFEWENIWVTAIGSRPFENSDWITTTIGFSCEVDWTCWEGKWRFTLKKVLFLVLEYQ